MTRLTRRELLAWMTAGTAGTIAGASWLGRGDGGGVAVPASTPATTGTAPRVARTTAATAPPSGSTVTTVGAAPAAPVVPGGRLLVVLEMPGGNDGLSMVVPYGDGAYYDARPTVAVPESDVLALDDRFGLHPNLSRIAARGAAAVVGVGAPEPDGSHFEMMQRWWRGDPAPAVDGLGWIGRLADVLDDGALVATAMTIGTGSHPILRADRAATLAIPGADAAWYLAGEEEGVAAAFQRGIRSIGGLGGDGWYGRMAATSGRTVSLAEQLVGAAEEDDGSSYPDSQLGRSLRFTRHLFELDGGPRVVHVSMEGDFDTHEGHAWRHDENMRLLDEAVGAFWDDLDASGLSDRVVLLTTSEFGRTVHENGSAGLDHGSASSMLVMGAVQPGVVGEPSSLIDLDDNDDLVATARFDAYLGAVVEGWLGVPASEVFPTTPDLLPLAFP